MLCRFVINKLPDDKNTKSINKLLGNMDNGKKVSEGKYKWRQPFKIPSTRSIVFRINTLRNVKRVHLRVVRMRISTCSLKDAICPERSDLP